MRFSSPHLHLNYAIFVAAPPPQRCATFLTMRPNKWTQYTELAAPWLFGFVSTTSIGKEAEKQERAFPGPESLSGHRKDFPPGKWLSGTKPGKHPESKFHVTTGKMSAGSHA
jgi:hypothetical protein